jgi:ATP-dependent DNA helicase 2 subunit 2
MADAIEGLSVPIVKEYRPYAQFKGQLALGDPSKYQTAMCIDVERYSKCTKASVPSASNFVIKSGYSGGDSTAQSSHTLKAEDEDGVDLTSNTGDDLTAVKNAYTYKVNDPSAPGGKRDVERDELAKGYEYGRTAVHISESDENVTKLETVESFSIIGFIPTDKVRFVTWQTSPPYLMNM